MLCFALLGDPPQNNSDNCLYWLKFFNTIPTEMYKNIIFINHPKDEPISKYGNIDEYIQKYEYLKCLKKMLNNNLIINNQNDNNHINTMWANVSIVYAELMMYQEAYLKYSELKKIILISNSCCPLYNFNIIYNMTINITDGKSWFSIMNDKPGSTLTKDKYLMSKQSNYTKSHNIFNFFSSFKVSQWTIIDIKHIKLLFINKEKKTYIVDKNNQCSDGTMTQIKINNDLSDDENYKIINEFLDIIDYVCKIKPLDEFAIQQFVLNRLFNEFIVDQSMNNIFISKNINKIMKENFFGFDYNYLQLLIKNEYSNLIKIFTSEKKENYIKTYVNEEHSNALIFKLDKNKTCTPTNCIFLGYKPSFFLCDEINQKCFEDNKFNKDICMKSCDKLNGDYLTICSTYTNWYFTVYNFSTIFRSINNHEFVINEYHANLDKKITLELFRIIKDTDIDFFNYVDFNESSKYEYIKDKYNFFDTVEKLQKFTYELYNIIVNEKINYSNKYNFQSLFDDLFFRLNEILNTTHIGKEIVWYYCTNYFLNKIQTIYSQKIKEFFDGYVLPEYHPVEYYSSQELTSINKKYIDILSNFESYINTIKTTNDNFFSKVINVNATLLDSYSEINKSNIIDEEIERITKYTIDIKSIGMPIDNNTIIPILLSGALFIRKCGNGSGIKEIGDKLLTQTRYIFNYQSSDLYGGKWFTKYLKYKTKYMELKRLNN